MYSSRSTFLCRFFLIAAAILPVSCFKSITTNDVIYENDFKNSNLKNLQIGGWSNNTFGGVDGIRINSYDGGKILGLFNNNQVLLTLISLPKHQAIRVDLVLNIHNNWKNDLWAMKFDDNFKLITGFSNDTAIKQSYPNWLSNGSPLNPAGCNAQNTALPGVCNMADNARGSSQYHIVTTAYHDANSFTLICNDAGGPFNDTCQRSWSLSNLKISILKN